MVEYKDRLHAAMKARSCGTQELADAMGISYQAVRKVLLGMSAAFSAPNNAKAAEYLHVQSDWLAAGIGAMTVADELQPAFGTWPFSPDLLPQVLALDDLQRAQVEGAIRAVLAQIKPAAQVKANAA